MSRLDDRARAAAEAARRAAADLDPDAFLEGVEHGRTRPPWLLAGVAAAAAVVTIAAILIVPQLLDDVPPTPTVEPVGSPTAPSGTAPEGADGGASEEPSADPDQTAATGEWQAVQDEDLQVPGASVDDLVRVGDTFLMLGGPGPHGAWTWTSPDGHDWARHESVPFAGNAISGRPVAAADEHGAVAAAAEPDGRGVRMWRTTDALEWQELHLEPALGPEVTLQVGAAAMNGDLVAVAGREEVGTQIRPWVLLSSDGGASFDARTLGSPGGGASADAVAIHDDVVVVLAAGADDVTAWILAPGSGGAWDTATLPAGFEPQRLTAGPDGFAAVGHLATDGSRTAAIALSDDGTEWSLEVSGRDFGAGAESVYLHVARTPEEVVLVGRVRPDGEEQDAPLFRRESRNGQRGATTTGTVGGRAAAVAAGPNRYVAAGWSAEGILAWTSPR